jgi:hypothetical protein
VESRLKDAALAHYDIRIAWCENNKESTEAVHYYQLRMRHGIEELPIADYCPLCRENDDCTGCPVKRKTGIYNCESTPFWPMTKEKTVAAFIKYMKEERDFLATLDYEEEL